MANPIRVRTFFSLVALVAGCGSHEFNNKNDPASSTFVSAEPTKSADSPTDPTGTSENPQTPSDPAAGSCLDLSCTPPTGTTFNFANSFSVTPSGCSVTKLKMFDSGTDLVLFLKANCGVRNGIYVTRMAYSGSSPSTPTLLTSDCSTSSGIESFSADKGASTYLLAYNCKNSSSSYTTKTIVVNSSTLAPSAVQTFETVTSDSGLRVVWNGDASAYAVIRPGKFQRFNEGGAQVGGSVQLKSSGGIDDAQVFSSNWYVIDDNNRCSKVSTAGTLQCDGIEINSSSSVFSSGSSVDDAYRFLSSGQFLSYDYYVGALTLADLGQSACSGSNPGNLVSLATSVSRSNFRNSEFGAIQLNATLAGVLVKSSANALFMAIFPLSGTFSFPSEPSITNFTTMNYAEARVIQSKIYVAYDKDGQGYVSFTSESVQ